MSKSGCVYGCEDTNHRKQLEVPNTAMQKIRSETAEKCKGVLYDWFEFGTRQDWSYELKQSYDKYWETTDFFF